MPSTVNFSLDVIEDDSKIHEAISKLGPGGVPCDLIANFGLSSPVPDAHDANALMARAYDVGQLYKTVPVGTYTPPHLCLTQVLLLG